VGDCGGRSGSVRSAGLNALGALLLLVCQAAPQDTPQHVQDLLVGAVPAREAPLALVLGAAPAPSAVGSLLVAGAAPGEARAGAPACAGDVCQPRVAVPGYEPRYTARGKRTELALAFLDRLHAEPLATVAWWVARTGVRLDFTPPQLDPGQHPITGAGWGRFQVLVRWKLDATNAPVFAARAPR
jgi:hypothetical protein